MEQINAYRIGYKQKNCKLPIFAVAFWMGTAFLAQAQQENDANKKVIATAETVPDNKNLFSKDFEVQQQLLLDSKLSLVEAFQKSNDFYSYWKKEGNEDRGYYV